MTGLHAPVRRLLVAALLVAALDLATKAVAIGELAGREIALGGPFFLGLIFNDALFGGMSTLNGWATPLSMLASACLLGLAFPVCRPLARFDATAPVALGLMVGAAVANPASLLLQPAGVTDFLGIELGGTTVLFNLADVAAYAGVALLGRTFLRVLAVHRAERSTARPRAVRRPRLEREVPLAVWRDGRREAPAPTPVPRTEIALVASDALASRQADRSGLRAAPPA